MLYGIDVSEHNGKIDWQAIKNAGMQFAIIRCSFGMSEDSRFVENVYHANKAGLMCGAYHYSYATTPQRAFDEAKFVSQLIKDSGCFLGLPIFLDMEDADGFKSQRMNITRQTITEIAETFIFRLRNEYDVGLYANLDWLERLIDWKRIGCSVWCAQWGAHDDFKGYAWQFTDSLNIQGKFFDGDVIYTKEGE